MDRYEKWFKEMMGSTFAGGQIKLTEQYIRTGDPAVLRQIKPMLSNRTLFRPAMPLPGGVPGGEYEWYSLSELVSPPGKMSEYDWRALRVIAALGTWTVMAKWFNEHLPNECPSEDYVGMVLSDLTKHGLNTSRFTEMISLWVKYYEQNDVPTSSGRYLLSLNEKDLRTVAVQAGRAEHNCSDLFRFLAGFPQARLSRIINDLLRPGYEWNVVEICRYLLERGRGAYEQDVLRRFRAERYSSVKFYIGTCLADYNMAVYGREALEAARASLAGDDHHNRHGKVCEWMVERFGIDMVPEIAEYMRRTNGIRGKAKPWIVRYCADKLGRDAMPIVIAGLNAGDGETSFTALAQLIAVDDGTHRSLIKEHLERGLSDPDGEIVIRHLGLVSKWDAAAVVDTLWALAEHTSKVVRESAARALGSTGDGCVDGAGKLLKNRKADVRLAAVTMLSTAKTTLATQALEEHLKIEGNDDIREAVLVSLQEAWRASGKTITRQDVEARALAGVSKIKWPPAAWVEAFDFGGVQYADGSPVPEPIVKYMLSRQSTCKEIRPLVELMPLYQLLDRTTTSDLALALLSGFLGSGADARDKWALTVSGLIGDDRIVPVIADWIKKWVDQGRGKLAEYAVQALALLATDRALLTIDSMAMRYRTKMKNVGTAATEAFDSAAESLGVTPEELGDKVIPWLGFEPGKPREIACGERVIQARIGLDFKLQYLEVGKNKRLSSLPSSAPDDVRAEFKELGALLREVSKAQVRRMETLMVRQRRWPVSEWNTLFMEHPLMVPFGVRLVWGAYDDSSKLLTTFRALEDGTLTDHADDSVDLPEGCSVGIIHPLELSEDERKNWLVHLSDYELQSPFPQLERPVVTALPAQAKLVYYKDKAGTELNAMTFKGRAERLGWRRGSVCDAGCITAYVKSFPAGGVDVFLTLEDMYVGIDMYSDIKLGDVFFVRHGSVTIGSYEYDEPENDRDPRLIRFGDVPPIVFSEAMGDLQKIAGSRGSEGEE